jgi:hypothetical protein
LFILGVPSFYFILVLVYFSISYIFLSVCGDFTLNHRGGVAGQVYFFDTDRLSNNPTPVWVRGPLGIPVTSADVGYYTNGTQLIECRNISPTVGETLLRREVQTERGEWGAGEGGERERWREGWREGAKFIQDLNSCPPCPSMHLGSTFGKGHFSYGPEAQNVLPV